MSNNSWITPAEAALAEFEAENEVHEPTMRVISDVREWRHIIGGNQELTWHGWAVPAILEVLAEENPDGDGWGWCERIAPLIADRIACDPQRAIEALSRMVSP